MKTQLALTLEGTLSRKVLFVHEHLLEERNCLCEPIYTSQSHKNLPKGGCIFYFSFIKIKVFIELALFLPIPLFL